jgi:DNA-directed RNA polymerase specialized sigma24 family protein
VRRRALTPEGREALDEARAATDLVRDARSAVTEHARRRRAAVLRANRHGASYRVIADALGVTVGNVQQIVVAARRDDPAGGEAS